MIEKIVSELIHDVAVSLIKEARDKAPIQTGELQRSIDIVSEKDGKVVVGHKANPNIMVKWQGKNTPYPLFVHEGTKAHTIQAKNKKALAGNGRLFGKKVKHPGTKANPYFERAAQSIDLDKIASYYGNKLENAVKVEVEKRLK